MKTNPPVALVVTTSAGTVFNVTADPPGPGRCVSFYDAKPRRAFEPPGQFVARYLVTTLAGHTPGHGLNLNGTVPAWQIDGEALLPVIALCRRLADAIVVSPTRRANGQPLPRLTSPAAVAAELAELAAIHRGQTHEYSKTAASHIRILQEATSRQQSDDFAVVLWSVGNPDHGQFHGPGEGSPTILAAVPTLRQVTEVVAAYISCYNLGAGNCPAFPVFHRQVQVAEVSYNRRLWLPGTRREIDPDTGKEVL